MLTPIRLLKIELSIGFTACLLGNEDRSFVIYLPPQSGKLIQNIISRVPSERPTSFDMILSLITATQMLPQHIVIDDEKEGVFFTKVFFEKKGIELEEICEIDARPSDALAICIHYQLPLFINKDLLERLVNLNEISAD